MTADPTEGQKTKRPRGRPRRDIDPDAVADAVAELFAEGGLEAVSILDTAEKLSVSRATLYRTVPTKEHLVGILFERSTGELTESARAIVSDTEDPADQLLGLVRLQVDAAIKMRRYMPVFFGGGDLPPEVFERWHEWSRSYEEIWADVIRANVETGQLSDVDPAITARLLLGACIWVSRWYRPSDVYDAEAITETAVSLTQTLLGGPSRQQSSARPTKKAATKKASAQKKTGSKASGKS
ncbi:TetR/AcrR family transcriptional regulator [Nocardioides sp. NPDC101246]|uniref:TetR/AcrR family transcriptional regulator n=1 Tax=Nocardioides sp. NPDC101246 TaxID=3364336 RepID=UPI0037FE5570